MKIMKKMAALLLAICLSVPCFAISAYAADGSIQFTDPSTEVGKTVEVTCAVKAYDEIGNADINLSYDTSMLKFKSGDNVTETEAGQLSYRGKGDSNELRFKLVFDVLKEGTTTVDVTAYNTFLSTNESLNCQKGSSTITIAAGTAPVEPEEPEEPAETEGKTVEKVTVNEKEYELSELFAEADIPKGFTETTIEYNGVQYKVVQQESSGVVLGYLADANKIGKFFLYDTETATFYPFEQIEISDSTVITVLANKTKLKLPKEYQKVTLTLNNQDFPAWQNTAKDGYYVVYAINNEGEKSLYQFDSEEGTYQRFEAPKVEKVEKKAALFGKLNDILEKHLDYVILGTGLGTIFFVVLVVVLGIKLHNRNAELDELYEEYDIDAEDDEDDDVEEVQPKEKKVGLEEEKNQMKTISMKMRLWTLMKKKKKKL